VVSLISLQRAGVAFICAVIAASKPVSGMLKKAALQKIKS